MKVPHLKDQLIGKALYLIPGYSFMHACIFSVDLLTNRLSTHKVRFEKDLSRPLMDMYKTSNSNFVLYKKKEFMRTIFIMAPLFLNL